METILELILELAQALRRSADLLEAIHARLLVQRPEPADEPLPRLLAYADAAAYLGISVRGFKTLVADGQIIKVPIGARVLFDRADLDTYIERLKRDSAPGP